MGRIDGFMLVHLYYRRAGESASRATMRAAEGDDHYIVGTSNHPFWSETQQAWVDLGELQIGEYIRLADGALATVEYSELEWAPEGQTFTTYNFEVADWHTYFVVPQGEADPSAGTWVHNAGAAKYVDKFGRTGYRKKSGQFAKKPGPKAQKIKYTSSDRRRDWKAEAENPTRDDFTPGDFERMRQGKAPQRYNENNPRNGGIESMERSHEPKPLREGGTRTVPKWPEEHAATDPYRHTGYDQ